MLYVRASMMLSNSPPPDLAAGFVVVAFFVVEAFLVVVAFFVVVVFLVEAVVFFVVVVFLGVVVSVAPKSEPNRSPSPPLEVVFLEEVDPVRSPPSRSPKDPPVEDELLPVRIVPRMPPIAPAPTLLLPFLPNALLAR